MGLFGFGSRNNYYDDDLALAPGAKDGKIYKIVQLTSISVFLIALILLILKVFQLLDINYKAIGVVLSVGVIGLAGFITLPWVRIFESIKEKQFKITAIVFMALTGVCAILWIASVWQLVGIFENVVEDMEDELITSLVNSFNIIRASLIVSLQFVIASGIATNIVKYRKTLLPFQIMYGVSSLYMDFYFTLLLTSITVTQSGVTINPTATFFLTYWQWLTALLIIAVALSIFPGIIFRRADRRRLLAAKKEHIKELAEEAEEKKDEPASQPAASNDTTEEKLQKIKALLDNGLITQEEYDAKRADILNEI